MMTNPSQRAHVAVIGNGYWGTNLVRNFHELGALACVCDVAEAGLNEAEKKYGVAITRSFDVVLADASIDAVVIAVPAAQHYEFAKRALVAGKDVYVEKPLALRSREGQDLVAIAERNGRVLMVGHILEYHPAMVELKRLVRAGELGKIQYIYSSRLNLGKLRTEENILWSFAPHDISAILSLLGELPMRVSAHGGSYLNLNVFDTTLSTCEFPTGVLAHLFVSWLHPFKEQKLCVIGDKKMAVFDDVQAADKLVLYPHRIDWVNRVPVAHREAGEPVAVAADEPLKLECCHFLECVATRNRPRTDGASAVRVLEVLEASEESLKTHGKPVEMCKEKLKYYAHPTAIIDAPCEIGDGTKIWHFTHVMANSKLGENCNLGQNVVISPDVKIGNNVKIQNNVSVYTGVELEDDVFCGPSMVFTNIINPRSHVLRKHEYRRTFVRQGASIGANATVVCGVTLGKYCFIGAGAVVNRDVPNYALMVGVPAQQIGWMCYCGVRLPDTTLAKCSACNRQYFIKNVTCTEAAAAESGNELPLFEKIVA
jgi:UDP-2-acetamido-3-amino-2,3-dideoxy-glucuronate N-acetyltransferase